MENAIETRLNLIYESVQLCINSAQCALSKLCDSDASFDELQLINIKLKGANQRFISEIHSYCKLIKEPNIDLIRGYTSTQIQAENLFEEIDFRIMQNNRDKNKVCKDGLSSKLPKMELAKFDGDVLKWYQFWDQFSSNVDSRNISDVDKLLYLQSVLEGNAKQAIEGLDTTNKNYRIAVDTLKERYGKPSSIIDAHYVALYRIKTASSNQVVEYRKVLNEIERHLRVLGSLGEDVNHNHLRVMIIEKFPEDIIYELRMKMTGQEETINNIRKNLEYIIYARESSSRVRKDALHAENDENGKDKITSSALHARSNEIKDDKFITINKNKPKLRKQFNRNNPTFFSTRKRFSDNLDRSNEPPRKKINRCVFCSHDHFNDECPSYCTVQERKSRLGNRCYNCFFDGHRAKQCRAKRKCRHCNKYGTHNRALCPIKCEKPIPSNNFHSRINVNTTLLQTCLADVVNTETRSTQQCRALLDCGSQRSYITEAIANILELPIVERVSLSIFTFGTVSPRDIESPVIKFKLITRTGVTRFLYANVVPHITNGISPPNFKNPERLWNNVRLKNLTFADDGSRGDKIDILIGNDYYNSFVYQERISITDDLFLVNSDFGWIWSGKVSPVHRNADQLSVLTYYQSNSGINNNFNEPDLPLKTDDITRLWDLESIGISDSPKSTHDEEAIRHFNETVQFSSNRYYVKWPWTEFPPNLPTNVGLAWGRLKGLLKRLGRSEIEAYNNVIKDQLQNGIIEIVPDQIVPQIHPVHYLPHHCVYSKDKPNKLRIVYDASSKSMGNRSLNECLYRGPLMLEDLIRLLIKFRQHPIGIVADVEKAFLQLGLQTEDRDVTRFLWIKNTLSGLTQDNILHLRFCRVPFGVISSPFLLNATIRYHLLKTNSIRMHQIAEDIYVDNIVTGARTTSDALKLYNECKQTFNSLSMNLREWNSNSKQVISNIPNKLTQNNRQVKILGIMWDVDQDKLSLNITINNTNNIETKRSVLKCIASVYDPCGFAVPIILPAKLFFQRLWKEKIKWDEKLNNELLSEWNKIQAKFTYLENININRCYTHDLDMDRARSNIEYELHCFTDSSLEAYSAVVYLRSSLHTNNIVSFVIGKNRLVPLKNKNNLQIPKLELMGVLIGCRLMIYVIKSLKINIKSQSLWTDSQVVLSWCKSEKLLPPFVSRRIKEIKQNKALRIRYVPTKHNPADVATRPEQVEFYDYWIKGPSFLALESDQWPKSPTYTKNSTKVNSFLAEEGLSNTEQISERKEIDNNMDEEIRKILEIQLKYFPREVKGCETDLSRNLKLYKDEYGVLRCKGRFKYSDLSYDQKEPILLSKDSEFTHKVISDLHEKNFHVGVSHTLSLLRKRFWVPQGRSTVQKIIRRCKQCVKYGGGPFKLPAMPDLPEERVKLYVPFTFTGLDYFGPLYVKGTSSEKRWVCLFTCLTIRAIHLEVVKDLSAEECLLAIRRFIAVRGIPCLIISDNATQFKLTADVIISDYCIKDNVRWKFIPELAPWFGGFYERLIGLVKHSLKRTLDKHILNHDQLYTVMKEIEAVINTRPLTAVSSELEHVLTPADFLRVGGALTANISDREFLESATVTKTNLIDGWKRGQVILQEFTKMFQNQYLTSLRERKDKHHQSRVTVNRAPRLGETVQIKADTNRAHWKVGKIIELPKGLDGQIRVAKIKVPSGEVYTRSIGHLFPLEIDDQNKLSLTSVEDTTPTQKTLQDSQINEPMPVRDDADAADTQSNRSQNRPIRSSAKRARELVKQWTSQLLTI